ncbi:MAG: flagellar filament capping protein FliD, partial [Desulfovibrio sp.]|nr:flagellar filament capping protein FliD [Desulfovibrio sp.]
MVQYASGSIRFSGLGSDYDFDGMIGKLAKIEGRQATQLARWKADWQTRLDAFKQLRGELMNLQSSLKKMNSMNSFFAKKAGSSEEKYATAVADADAMNSNYSVDVKKLATYGSWTKDTGLHEKNQVIADDAGSLTYSYKGKYRTVKVAKGTTIEGLVNLINNDSKNLGVRAQLIQSTDGISFQLRGMDTGKSNTLVIRDTQNLNGLDVTLTPVNWADSENKAELINKYSSTGRYDSINTSSETKTFIYTVDDKRHVIDIPPGMNISQLVDAINAETPGIASLVPSDSNNDSNTEYTFTLERVNSEYTANWDANLQQIVGAPPRDFTSPNEKILSAGDPATEFQFTVTSSDGEAPNNVSYKVSITEDTTLNDLVNSLKSQLGDRASVKIVQSPGASPPIYNLEVEMRDKVHRVTVEDGSLTDLAYIQPSSPNWDVRHGENAEVGINGRYLEVASNTLKSGEVVPGMTFMLKKVGETEISVSNDTEKMMENIQEFVTAINNFRTLLTAFTSYDKEKEVVDSEYAESQFDMQKGGVLQGNYGIQMV